MEPAAAARMLMQALEKETDGDSRQTLAVELAAVASRLNQADAIDLCERAIRKLQSSLEQAPNEERIAPSTYAYDRRYTLDPFLTNTSRSEVNVRAAAVATAVGWSVQGCVPPLPALPVASEPLPCCLATQDLVELLKMPTCFGGARQVVLAHLGNRYGRRFANHWEFVRFAKEQQLDLEFTTLPKRPSRP
jgi:hypothetical protein